MTTDETLKKQGGPHPIKNKGRIYTLLCAGWSARAIARHLNLNESSVRRHAKRLTRDGQIERLTKSPAFYQKKAGGPHPLSYYPSSAPSIAEVSRMMPAKFGANFLLITKNKARVPGQRYNSRGTATISPTTGSVPHTFQLHRYKAQLWLHSGAFRGSNPDEILKNGKEQIMALAAHYEAKFGITLTLSRFYEGEEWVMTSKEMSKATAKDAGIEKGGRIEVGESIHKFADFSHPDDFQFNTQHEAQNKNSARDDARTHRYLYERLPRDVESIMGVLKAATETITVINQRLIFIEEQNKRRG